MGTRSRIAFVDTVTDELISIYCHYDGYLEGVGKTLLENYCDHDRLDSLANQGDRRSLKGFPLDTNEAFNGKDTQCLVHDNQEDFEQEMFNSGEEYVYLYRDDEWWYRMHYGTSQAVCEWRLLEQDVVD